ncbi:hypothetical protein K469DRAFT_717490 [Zopfia rhizophila CBS 207.26]|uniref:NAD dependent epimerase/dehydratase n=1 Tax=Zopfia rhizophila CBS 207.26 TaxID=1314779 RepID=A0A6A6DHG5_9PEZI|nr:hypothetical protein K469DRAFT_717490 [Zopfia rhizophila CBS 207.26]
MGQEASKPQPGTKIRIIGAGLPRTGTASFSAALSILLNGPVYHGGTQMCLGRPSDISNWISVLGKTPIRSSGDREYILKEIDKMLDGYVATTDTPGAQFVPELMELYPDAKVICTVRDPDAWAKSIDKTAGNALMWFLGIVLLPLPGMRNFPRYLEAIRDGRWNELYAKPGDGYVYGRQVWDRHMEWLKKLVPEKKLVFFDVSDGWGPLCAALGVEVPEAVEFPKSNDGDAMDRFAKEQIRRGLKAWAKIFGVCTLLGGIGWAAASRW